MIERIEKEDIETQIYKDIFITNDDDGKIRERRSLTTNLHRHLNHTTWMGETNHQEIGQEGLQNVSKNLPKNLSKNLSFTTLLFLLYIKISSSR